MRCDEPGKSKARGCVDGSGLRVAGVVDFHTLRQEPLAATLAAAGENSATILGLHAGAETELTLARALGGLIGAFHKA